MCAQQPVDVVDNYEPDLAADGWYDDSDDRWNDWLRGTRVNYRCLDCGRTAAQVTRFGHRRGCDYAD